MESNGGVMDKNAIKKFAIWARREMIERVSQRAMLYGITPKNTGEANAESVDGHLLTFRRPALHGGQRLPPLPRPRLYQ